LMEWESIASHCLRCLQYNTCTYVPYLHVVVVSLQNHAVPISSRACCEICEPLLARSCMRSCKDPDLSSAFNVPVQAALPSNSHLVSISRIAPFERNGSILSLRVLSPRTTPTNARPPPTSLAITIEPPAAPTHPHALPPRPHNLHAPSRPTTQTTHSHPDRHPTTSTSTPRSLRLPSNHPPRLHHPPPPLNNRTLRRLRQHRTPLPILQRAMLLHHPLPPPLPAATRAQKRRGRGYRGGRGVVGHPQVGGGVGFGGDV